MFNIFLVVEGLQCSETERLTLGLGQDSKCTEIVGTVLITAILEEERQQVARSLHINPNASSPSQMVKMLQLGILSQFRKCL